MMRKEKEQIAAEMAALDTQGLANELIKSWQAWDERPGDEHTAVRHEAAIQETAGRMGVTGTKLLIALSEKKINQKLSIGRTVRTLFKTFEAAK